MDEDTAKREIERISRGLADLANNLSGNAAQFDAVLAADAVLQDYLTEGPSTYSVIIMRPDYLVNAGDDPSAGLFYYTTVKGTSATDAAYNAQIAAMGADEPVSGETDDYYVVSVHAGDHDELI